MTGYQTGVFVLGFVSRKKKFIYVLKNINDLKNFSYANPEQYLSIRPVFGNKEIPHNTQKYTVLTNSQRKIRDFLMSY